MEKTAEAPVVRRRPVIFGALCLAMLMGALDQTIVATALPTIVSELGGLEHLSWVVTAYILTATATTPLWGKLSDQYGRRRLFLTAIVIFVTGSALCGMAQSMWQLIAFRAFQGVGAGGLMTLAMALVGDIVPPRERGRWQGYIQVVFVLASIAGPLLGGLFVDHLDWRWVFYVNLPIGVVALGVVAAVLRLPAQRPATPSVDFLGAGLLAASIVSLLLVTVWGGQQYAWDSWQIVSLAVAAAGTLVGFIVWEGRAAEPVLPLRLFRDPVFGLVCAVLFIASLALFAAVVFMPVFLQVVTGASATNSGLLLLPMLLASTVSTVVSGRIITRTGRYKIFPVAGLAFMATGLFLMSTMGPGTSRLTITVFMAVFGLGFGMVTQVLVVVVQNSVSPREIGTATASANLFRALGGSIGVPFFGAVLTARLHLPAGLDPDVLRTAPDRLRTLPEHTAVAAAVADALQTVFLIAAPIAVAGFVVVLFLKETPLRGR